MNQTTEARQEDLRAQVITVSRTHTGPSTHEYSVNLVPGADITDDELIALCDGFDSYNFGGGVSRQGDRATVKVFID